MWSELGWNVLRRLGDALDPAVNGIVIFPVNWVEWLRPRECHGESSRGTGRADIRSPTRMAVDRQCRGAKSDGLRSCTIGNNW